jgi:hypothetical protein
VERVHRRHERQHRLVGVGVQRGELLLQQREVPEFRHRHLAERGLVGEGRRERGIFGKAEERHQFRVGKQAEQVDYPRRGSRRLPIPTAHLGHGGSLTTMPG